MDSTARDHRDSKLRKKKQSIIRSSQSVAAICRHHFLLAQFYDVECVPSQASNGPMSPGHFDLCDSDEISALLGKELQRAYLDNSEAFRQRALCGVRETRALSELLSASYFIHPRFFPITIRT